MLVRRFGLNFFVALPQVALISDLTGALFGTSPSR
jgi:hypothetical protein